MKTTTISKILFLALILFATACTEDSLPGPDPDVTEPDPGMEATEATIWTGANLTFSKSNGADPNAASNQDRLTDRVWITRGNNGGQIFNVVEENSSNKGASPRGTQWAVGSIDDIDDLNFSTFRSAVGSPSTVVGKNLVMRLVDENIYLSVRFTSWSSNKGGGFTYERSTAN